MGGLVSGNKQLNTEIAPYTEIKHSQQIETLKA